MEFSKLHSGSAYGNPKLGDLAELLNRKYRKAKWVRLIPAALEELKNEGHGNLFRS